MSSLTTTNVPEPSENESSGRLWKSVSIVCSIGVIGWSFSVPFQRTAVEAETVTSARVSTTPPIDPVEQVTRQQLNSEDYRARAIASDRAFMQSLESQREVRKVRFRPTAQETRTHWQSRKLKKQEEIEALADAPENSIQWQYRQQLISTLNDGPL